MAHFVRLDRNNIVVEVIVVDNNILLDANGNEVEQKGIDYLRNFRGGNGTWKQTSYNGNFRDKFAGIGFSYDVANDRFVPPKPVYSPEYVYDSASNSWVPPVAEPDDGESYVWNPNTQTWEQTTGVPEEHLP